MKIIVTILIFTFISSCKQEVSVEKGATASVKSFEDISLAGGQAQRVDFGQLLANTTVIKLIRISKSGRFPANGLQMSSLSGVNNGPFTYTDGTYPGVNGDCGDSLSTGADSCFIEVQYSPTSTGVFDQSFSINYNDGIDDESIQMIFSGHSGTRAVLTFDQAQTLSLGLVEPPFVRTLLVKVSNIGGIVASGLNSEIFGTGNLTFSGGPYPGTNGTCQSELNSAASCFIELSMSQTVEGDFANNFALKYTDLSGQESRTDFNIAVKVHEFIANIKLKATDLSYNFGSVLWGKSKEQKIVYVNSGYSSGQITNINISDPNYVIDVSRSTCSIGITLGISSHCEIMIVFTAPTGTEADILSQNGGSFSALVSIDYNNSSSLLVNQNTVSFASAGQVPGVAKVRLLNSSTTITSHDFSRVGIGENTVQSFEIKNIGQASIVGLKLLQSNLKKYVQTVSSPELETDQICTVNTGVNSLDPGCYTGYSLLSNNCNPSLVPGSTCRFSISYTPKMPFIHLMGLNGISAPVTITYSQDPEVVTANASYELALTGDAFSKPKLEWFSENTSFLNPIKDYTYLDIFEGGSLSSSSPQFKKRLWLKNTGPEKAFKFNLTIPIGQNLNPSGIFKYEGTAPFQVGTHVDGQLCKDNLPSGGYCYVDVKIEDPTLPFGNYTDYIDIAYSDNANGDVTAGGGLYYNEKLSLITRVKRLGTLVAKYSGIELPYTMSEVSPGGKETTVLNFTNIGDFSVTNISISVTNTGEFSHENYIPLDSSDKNCSETLIKNVFCYHRFFFHPNSIVPQLRETKIRVNYFNGIANTFQEFDLKGTASSIGHYVVDFPGENKIEAWRGLSGSYEITSEFINGVATPVSFNLKNLGLNTVTSLVVRSDNLDISSTDCNYTTIEAGKKVSIADFTSLETCILTLNITPNKSGFYQQKVYFEYKNSNVKNVQLANVSGNAIRPTLLSLAESTLDFDRIVVQETKTKNVKIKNLGDKPFVFHPDRFTLTTSGEYTFEVDSSCPPQLFFNQSCNLKFTFSPTNGSELGQTYSATFDINYSPNGTDSANIALSITGKSAPKKSTFNGWSQVKSIGSIIKEDGSTESTPKIEISWKAIVIDSSYTLKGINIYRTSDPSSIDLSSVHATISDLNQTSFVDNNGLSAGTTYYYKAVPTVEGVTGSEIPSDHDSADSIIEIQVPSSNMVLVHHWMLNQQVCTMNNKAINRGTDYSCTLDGAGTSSGKFKRSSYFIDTFELGVSPQGAPSLLKNVFPVVQSRGFAKTYCESIGKRLPTKLEFTQAALWSEEDYELAQTDNAVKTAMENKQLGVGVGSCNINGNLKKTGESTLCESRYGAFDLVGNVAEFTSETLTSGTDLSSLDLKDDQFLYNNVDLNSLLNLADIDCFNFATGIYKLPVNSACIKSADVTTTVMKKYFMAGDNTNTPADNVGVKFMPVLGGGFSDSSAGPWNTRWKIFSTEEDIQAGFRCVKDIAI